MTAGLMGGVAQAGDSGGGEGGGGGETGPRAYMSILHPNGDRASVRKNRDGSRTITRIRKGRRTTQTIRNNPRRAAPRPNRSRPSMSMTNPDGSTISIHRNADGSTTTVRTDANGNVTRAQRNARRGLGKWSASGYNHTTGYGGTVVGDAAGNRASSFGYGQGYGSPR